MTANKTHRDVTYIGKEDPFLDRNYGSNLEFVPGQTRSVPAQLAARFLQHTDCFEEAVDEKPAAKPAAQKAKEQEKAKEKDDTQKVLEEQEKAKEEQRRKDEQVLEMHMQIDSMTKKDVAEFMLANFKEKADMGKSKADLQAIAKNLVSQFGA